MIRKTDNGTFIIPADELVIKHTYGNEACSTCPLCRDSREHPEDASLKVNIKTGAGFCHHCHEKVFVPDFAEKVRTMPRAPRTVRRTPSFYNISPLDGVCIDFLENRCIDPKIVAGAAVGTTVLNGVHYLAFPFIKNGAVVNIQLKRADGMNKEFRFFPGGEMIPWNIDCLANGNGKSPLYITEGMMDALAMIQSGYRNVISVPNGSGSKMESFDAYREVIKRNFSYIVFAGDTDRPGTELRDKVKDYFSDMDVAVVRWHWADYLCKDANEMLMCGSTNGVAFCVENAKFDESRYFDVMDFEDSELLNVYEHGMPSGLGIGVKSMDNLVKFLPGYMYVISGYPGSGKSSMVNFITMSLLNIYKWRTLFFTPEKLPCTNHRIELISLVTGKKFDNRVLRRDELQQAMNFLSGNVFEMKMDINRDISFILAATEVAIRQHGIKVLVIDPFLYLDMKTANNVPEPTRIAQLLCRVRMFAQKHNILVLLVAHPRKPNVNAGPVALNEELYEVAGSSAFYNFCDVGFVLKRKNGNSNLVKLKCGKSRFSYLGRVGETTLAYNEDNGRYCESSQYDSHLSHNLINWADKLDFFKKEGASDYVCEKPF